MVNVTYARGWEDCIDAVLHILNSCKGVRQAKSKVSALQVLVKNKKFEQLRKELEIVDGLF